MLRVTRQIVEALAAGDGKVRVTRQIVEALAAGDGKVRVTRQIVEVLYPVPDPIIERSITDTLTFSDAARYTPKKLSATDSLTFSDEAKQHIKELSATDSLTFNEIVAIEGTYNLTISDIIVFGQVASYWTGTLSTEDSLTFSENAFIPNVIEKAAVSSFVFNDEAIYWTNRLSADNTISFIDVTDTGVKSRFPEDTLVFSQEATYDATVKRLSILQALAFVEEAILHGKRCLYAEDNMIDDVPAWDPDTGQFYWAHYGLGDTLSYLQIKNPGEGHWLPLTDEVGLVHVKASGTSLSATDTIVFVDSTSLYDATDVLVFSDIATAMVSKPIYEEITFTDTVGLNQTRNLAIVQDFNINQAFGYEIIRSNVLCSYSPFVGSSSDPNAPTPPSTTPPTLTRQNNIQLTYNTTVLTLRGPEFSNRDGLAFQRIKRETRGGTLIIYADPLWPKTQHLSLNFVGLSEAESQEVLDFIISSLGKVVTIRDWENQNHSGIIMNPDNPIIRNGVGNNSMALELELI